LELFTSTIVILITVSTAAFYLRAFSSHRKRGKTLVQENFGKLHRDPSEQ